MIATSPVDDQPIVFINSLYRAGAEPARHASP